jgi:metal-sulfur cluster biosynthetic enzyme
MPVSEDKVREELKKVIDPELFVNIVDLGLIYTIDVKEKETVASEEDAVPKSDVSIEMTMTSPACPAGPQLIAGSKNVVSQLEEVDEVEVKLVMDPPWTPDRMTEDARDQLGIY